MKPVSFLGDSLARLREFPEDARRDSGHQLLEIQHGREPNDWKPMATIGAGVREIRLREASGAFRVIDVANLGAAVLVLHAFQKKTQRTSTRDIGRATSRLRSWLSKG